MVEVYEQKHISREKWQTKLTFFASMSWKKAGKYLSAGCGKTSFLKESRWTILLTNLSSGQENRS